MPASHFDVKPMTGRPKFIIRHSTRPDLSAALNFYSRFQANATEKQWVEAKRMLRYLKDTQHFGLIYRRQTAPVLAAYADSDWAGSLDSKSTTGFLLQVHGNVVCWSTKKQNTVALSSTEAEYVALACAAAELVWLRNLLRDMHVTYEDSTIMFEQPILHTLAKQIRAPKDETPRRQVPLYPGFGNEQNHRCQVYTIE
jgi:hypothetical protein